MKKYATTILKYLFSLVFVILSYKTTKKPAYILFSLVELSFIFALSNLLVAKNKLFRFLNDLFMFLFNAQILVLYFASSFITFVMLQNLRSIQDLAGKAVIYSIGIILVLVFSFLPIKPIEGKKLLMILPVPILAALEIIMLVIAKTPYTPSSGYLDLYSQRKRYQEIVSLMAMYNGRQDYFEEHGTYENYDIHMINGAFLDSTTIDRSKYPIGTAVDHMTLPDKTNVITIFIEGYSYNILTDDRNIAPNINRIKDQSLSFENYYNHTFATYKGLKGQLYSGVSIDDTEPNNLPSIMDVLRDHGYYSTFINTEPLNETFTNYLNDQAFDTVISDDTTLLGHANSIRDKEAYEMLFDYATQYNDEGKTFFLGMYSFGTHATLNSTDQLFGDGSDRALNKFYDADYQIGAFFDKFIESPLADNTLLIITTDHSTFADEDFVHAFPDWPRDCTDCDEIPYIMYYKGELTGTVDAEGRTSLDYAPTVLDVLGYNRPDSFLGQSLFDAKNSNTFLDLFFWDPTHIYYTGDDSMIRPDEESRNYVIRQYSLYLAKKQL